MIRSMTGFASAERQYEFGRMTWEVRSVNHRYLEIGFRVPEEFRVLEPEIRRILGEFLSRGKVDAALRFVPAASAVSSNLVLNRELLDRLLDLHAEIGEVTGLDREPDPQALMRWQGVIEERPPDAEPLHEAALELLAKAAAGLQASRGREGQQMDAAIRERLDSIETWVERIRGWLPEIRDGLREKLLTRIEDLQQPLEPGRLEQEVAFLAQKIDVDEELDRLAAHVTETRLVLDRDDPVGRRLDFLMQEFNRESNTLSSKSVDNRTTQAAVELKVAIEQMREQVQNIE
ncbi:MAG: YicC family protein [Xanthomonadales bacterium]|nr:YicC family protein [Xanthomonadales bacterium]